jgi:CheY-like chemotaxis protein
MTSKNINSTRRVLVVDNQRELLFAVSEHLARREVDVSQAVNGFQALQMARELQPEAVVVDDAIQGLEAGDLCRQLKADPQTRDIKLLLLCAEPELAKGCGADGHIKKPTSPEEIVRRMEEMGIC